jgi:hypothetical protein
VAGLIAFIVIVQASGWLRKALRRHRSRRMFAFMTRNRMPSIAGRSPLMADALKTELDRRLKVACNADPTKRRIDMLQRDIVRTQKSIDRLLTAYQEELISLDELRRRNPPLRQREKAARSELESIADQTTDRAAYRAGPGNLHRTISGVSA